MAMTPVAINQIPVIYVTAIKKRTLRKKGRRSRSYRLPIEVSYSENSAFISPHDEVACGVKVHDTGP